MGFTEGLFGLGMSTIGFLLFILSLGLFFGMALLTMGLDLGADALLVPLILLVIGFIVFKYGMSMVKKAGSSFYFGTIGLFGILIFITAFFMIIFVEPITTILGLFVAVLGLSFMEYGFKFKLINNYIHMSKVVKMIV